ncbi:MAG: hypothetical protein ACHP9Z_28730 [Streptosporangiales bacterium]
MSGPDRLIADALRGLAEQAQVPSEMADAAWRAGRRRRLAAIAASAAGAAAAVALAILLPLALAGTRAPRHPVAAVPLSLGTPVELRQVAAIGRAPCPPGSHGLLGLTPPACFQLTGAGMTLTHVESGRVVQAGPTHYAISFTLAPADRGRLAALAGKLAGLPSPRDELAIIIARRVVAHPVVVAAMHGQVQISGFASRAVAGQLLQFLLSR